MIPLLIACALLAVAEAVLRYGGHGFPTVRFIQDTSVSPAVWRDNQAFVRRFFPGPWYPDTAPVQLTVQPAPNALRVAVIGESAAYGYPDPAFGFARMLEVQLEHQYPDRSVELINAAESGVTSPILLEELPSVLAMKPDLLVLYIGNNEFIGPYGASNPGTSGNVSTAWIRAQILASRLRLSQREIYRTTRVKSGEHQPPQCRPLPNSDPAVEGAYDRYEANLRAMLDLAVDAGVPVVLCTVAVNERDWSPFADSHRAGPSSAELEAWKAAFDEGKALLEKGDSVAAIAALKRAEAIDAEPATLAYALAQVYRAIGDAVAAEEAYTRALVQDALRYRTTPAMNERVRRLAAEYANSKVVLADCAAQVRQAVASGTQCFYEYCHLAGAGNYEVASSIRAAAAPLMPATSVPVATLPAVEERLGWTPWHARENLRSVDKLTAKEPYMGRSDYPTWVALLHANVAALDAAAAPAALAPVRVALEVVGAQHPGDPFLLRNLAHIQSACGDPLAATATLNTLVSAYPGYDAAWVLLAQACTNAKDFGDAATAWRRAFALRSDRIDWRSSLGEALFADGQFAAARVEWRALLEVNPENVQAWWRMGQCYEGEKNLPTAIATYREALTHVPTDPGFYYYLAKALKAQDEPDAARTAVDEGLRVAPDHAGLKALAVEMAP